LRKVLAIAIVLAVQSAVAWGSPFDTFGTGPRAIAMGGAYAAVGGDAASFYYNVATLTKSASFQIEFGYHRAEMAMFLNDRQCDIDPDRGLNFGLIIGKKFFERQFRVGALAFTPDDHFMRLVLPPRTAFNFVRYNNVNHIQGQIIGAAFQIFPWWSIGGGASFVSGTIGGVDFIIRDDRPAEGDLHSWVVSSATPVLGTYFEPLSWLSVGFSFREKQQMVMDLDNIVNMKDLKVMTESGLVVFHHGRLVLSVTSNTHFAPRQFELGVAVEPKEGLIFSADATHYKYTDMKSTVAFSDCWMEGDFGEVFPLRPPLHLEAPKLRDIIGWAFGAEGVALKTDHLTVHLRGGYNYRPTPVLEQDGINNFADSDTHIFSTGLGFTFADFSDVFQKPISLDVFEQYHYLEPRIMHKGNPTNDAGDYKIEGSANSIGAAVTLRF